MTSTAPKLRGDLIFRQQEADDERFFVIKDPATGNFFRLREAEQFIARQIDGETPLEEVRRKAEERFGATLTSETLHGFVKKLEKSGLLEPHNGPKKERRGKKTLISGNILYLRFRAFDPDRLFNRMLPHVRLFFTPAFVILSAATILLAIGELAANWPDFVHDLSRLYQISSIPLLAAAVLAVVGAHEFSHGLTCKHFGGEVHEVGFLLVYFQPAFYCNVSDAWLFPEKSKRLWVGFAGPYFELFLWALATLVWRVTDVDAGIRNLALIVVATSGLKTLLNFNPFIKLDGYYLLSDYLLIPNLRKRSFRLVGGLIKRLFGFSSTEEKEQSQRVRRICLMYGSIATVSSFILLVYVFVSAAKYVGEGRQPTAVMLTFGLLGLKLRRRVRRLFGKASNSSDPTDDGEEFDTATLPAEEKGAVATAPEEPRAVATALEKPRAVAAARQPKRRKGKRRWIRRCLWAALAASAVLALFLVRMDLRVSGPVSVLPIDNTDVRAEVEGMIDHIYVKEGDHVKAGALIARLSDKDLRADLNQTEGEINETAARLNMLKAGPTEYELEVARTAVGKAEDSVKYAKNRQARFEALLKENLRPRSSYEDAAEQATAAEDELLEAQSRLTVLLKGTRPEEIEATQAQADRLEAKRRYLQEQLQLLRIVSPTTGIVATPARELKEMRHVLVEKGDLIMKIYDLKTLTAQIFISEKEIDNVRAGQEVMLRVRALPETTFNGKVSSIATSARDDSFGGEGSSSAASASSSANANKTILVTTQIDNRDLLLKPEMTGEAKIFCGRMRIIDLITRRLARTVRVEFWSWW